MEADAFGRIDAQDLRDFVARCMGAVGCTTEQSSIIADILVEADLRGVHSHGVNRLEMYVSEIQAGEVDHKAQPEIVSDTEAIACVDGHNGLGMPIAKFCMDLAIEKAKKLGIGWVVCRGTNHYGIAGYYAMMASKQNMVGMSYTNTSPCVFPTRSAEAALGTNPIAVAAPTNNPDDPFVLDMATSTVALGKIEYKDRQGKDVPVGWGADSKGQVSTDTKIILDGGGLLPLGGTEENSGYKGYGLAMMVELFCSALSGSDYGKNIPPWRKGRKRAANLGQCFVCIDPAKFGSGFNDRMSGLVGQMRDLTPVDPSRPVLVAGEPEKNMEKHYTAEGIALHKNLINNLQDIAEKLKVEPLKVKS